MRKPKIEFCGYPPEAGLWCLQYTLMPLNTKAAAILAVAFIALVFNIVGLAGTNVTLASEVASIKQMTFIGRLVSLLWRCPFFTQRRRRRWQ